MKTLILTVGCWLTLNLEARDISYRADAFGYLAPPSCTAGYLNIDAQASQLIPQAAGADPATDEGAALLSLPLAYDFYDESHQQVMVSTNGYLAFATNTAEESGADFSNDCLFPSVPDNQPGSLKRIMPFHDDLMADSGGIMQWAHYANCPVVDSSSACSVIEWQDWRLTASPGSFSFQVVLLHEPAAIVLQYDHRTPAPVSASVGFQHAGLFSGQVLACDQPTVSLADTAVCFSNPHIFSNGFE